MTPMLTTAQVLGLTEGRVTPGQFRKLLDDGLVVPAEGGGTQGAHRRFSLTQAVGLMVGTKLFGSERGCRLEYVAEVMNAFGAVTEEWLRAKFQKDKRTIFLDTCERQPRLIRPEQLMPGYDRPDVQAIFSAVLALAAQPDR